MAAWATAVAVLACHAWAVAPLRGPEVRRVPVAPRVAAVGAAERMRFPTLQPADFQHPEDRAATASLRALWPLETAIRRLLLPAIEDLTFLDNIATGVLVGPDQLPSLYAQLREACDVLGMSTAPDLYVRQNPVPNAFTLAVDGRRPFIVVHSSLIDLLTPEETQAVLAHELGHLKCEHGVYITAANLVAIAADALDRRLGAFVASALLQWRRAAELTCDRAALLVAQDKDVVLASLLKLTGGTTRLGNELSTDAFLRQVQRYDQGRTTRFGRTASQQQASQLTHPLPILRASELNRWAEGEQYRGLVRSAERRQRALGGVGA